MILQVREVDIPLKFSAKSSRLMQPDLIVVKVKSKGSYFSSKPFQPKLGWSPKGRRCKW